MIFRLSLLLSFAACAVGCAGSGAATAEVDTLADVNARLHGREAQIELVDGTMIRAADIMVASDSTRFQADASPVAIATERVHRISFESKPAAAQGWAIGGALAGFALLTLSGESLGAPVVVAGGAVLGLLLGVGERVDRSDGVVYEALVSQYAPE